jgi:hypothetical protein
LHNGDTELAIDEVIPVVSALGFVIVGLWLIRLARRRSNEELSGIAERVRDVGADEDFGQIRLRRNGGVRPDRRRAYRIYVDDREVGHIRAGEVTCVRVPPGERIVSVRIDWARSNSLAVLLEPGERSYLYCEPRATPWTAVFWMTFGSNRYIRLVEDEGSDPRASDTAAISA